MNILFEYIYRDAGNYKQFGEVIFSNPQNLSEAEILDKLISALADGMYFDPKKVDIPIINKHKYNPKIDHDWYEFDRIELTETEPTDTRSINYFIAQLETNPVV